MRVLHIGKYSPPFFGGIENFMMDLSDACVTQSQEVAAIVHHHQAWQSYDERQVNGVTVYRVPSYGNLMFAPISPSFGIHLNRVIADFKPHVLHIHLPNTAAFFALFSSSAKRIPWIVHWHSDVLGEDSPWFLKAFYPFYRPFEQAVLKRAKQVIATSQSYLHSSIALKPFMPKCQVISLGIKAQLECCPPLTIRDKNKPLQLLMVGRLTYYKGHKYLIAALALLKQRGISAVQLNIVGDGELQSALVQQITQLGLTDEVKLLGKISNEQLRQQFLSADCLCLPSIERTEAFGVVLMEAAAYAVPAIVSDVPGSGMSWAVVDGETGMVVKRSDAQSLATAIDTLYHDPEQLNCYAIKARQRFENCFNIDEVAKTTIELYQHVIEP